MTSSRIGPRSHRYRNITTAACTDIGLSSTSALIADLALRSPTISVHTHAPTLVSTRPTMPSFRPSLTSSQRQDRFRSANGPLPRTCVITSAVLAAISVGRIVPISTLRTDTSSPGPLLRLRIAPIRAAEASRTNSTSRNAPNPQRGGGSEAERGAPATPGESDEVSDDDPSDGTASPGSGAVTLVLPGVLLDGFSSTTPRAYCAHPRDHSPAVAVSARGDREERCAGERRGRRRPHEDRCRTRA